MSNSRTPRRFIAVLATWLCVCAPVPALAQDASPAGSAQDPLSRAKVFYASAEYEEALQVLDTLGKTPNVEAAAYQVYCLVALERRDEARAAIESIVRLDPRFHPSEAQASPRIRAFFDEVRKPLLPELARQSYAKAKAAFDRKDWVPALEEFDRAIALLDEVGGAEAGTADLRTLAVGFRDLARTALQPPAVAPAPTEPPVAAEPAIYGVEHADVKPPAAISKQLPAWRPAIAEERMSFSGAIELVIDENGKVLSVSLVDSVHPRYDGPLLEAAKTWTFRPATKNGVPVKYHYTMAIQLGR